MDNFTEQDWKLFRAKLPKWQENYMDRLNKEYQSILNSSKLPSEKFWELEKRIFNDKKHAGVTAVMSRSRFLENICSLLYEKAIIFDDLSDFSDELKNHIRNILNYN